MLPYHPSEAGISTELVLATLIINQQNATGGTKNSAERQFDRVGTPKFLIYFARSCLLHPRRMPGVAVMSRHA